MPHQEALTVIAKVDRARVASVQGALGKLRENAAQNDVIPFGKIAGCHFGRVLFLPESQDLRGNTIDPQLLLLTDCDGPADRHLESLVDAAGEGIDQLFGHCHGYPRASASRAERLSFLRNKTVNTKANYVHRQGRTVAQIRAEAELRTALQDFVATHRLGDVPALEARERLRTFLRDNRELAWALEAPPGLGLEFLLRKVLHATVVPAGVVAMGPLLVPVVLLMLALVRLAELTDPAPHVRPTPEHVRELAALEDIIAHNGFTASGYVKPGWLRRVTVASVLPLIGYGTRHLFTRDSLAGVKTIHFARWIPLDGHRRVLFASNYDGSLASYNNDFIDLVAWGLNLVFSNGYGYPKTRWMIFGGATREQEFKDFLRRHQVPTPAWYSAYPDLTAVNVERNAKLRAGLRGRMNEREAQRWLRLL